MGNALFVEREKKANTNYRVLEAALSFMCVTSATNRDLSKRDRKEAVAVAWV